MDKIYIYIKKPLYLPWLSLSNDPIVFGKGTIISKQRFLTFLDCPEAYEEISIKFNGYFLEFADADLNKYLKTNKRLFY